MYIALTQKSIHLDNEVIMWSLAFAESLVTHVGVFVKGIIL